MHIGCGPTKSNVILEDFIRSAAGGIGRRRRHTTESPGAGRGQGLYDYPCRGLVVILPFTTCLSPYGISS